MGSVYVFKKYTDDVYVIKSDATFKAQAGLFPPSMDNLHTYLTRDGIMLEPGSGYFIANKKLQKTLAKSIKIFNGTGCKNMRDCLDYAIYHNYMIMFHGEQHTPIGLLDKISGEGFTSATSMLEQSAYISGNSIILTNNKGSLLSYPLINVTK